jgi:hypothetical protein
LAEGHLGDVWEKKKWKKKMHTRWSWLRQC